MLIFKHIMHSFLWPFTYFINYFFPENKNPEDLNDLIYFDFETTGLNPYHDKIIEYAFIQEEPMNHMMVITNIIHILMI